MFGNVWRIGNISERRTGGRDGDARTHGGRGYPRSVLTLARLWFSVRVKRTTARHLPRYGGCAGPTSGRHWPPPLNDQYLECRLFGRHPLTRYPPDRTTLVNTLERACVNYYYFFFFGRRWDGGGGRGRIKLACHAHALAHTIALLLFRAAKIADTPLPLMCAAEK